MAKQSYSEKLSKTPLQGLWLHGGMGPAAGAKANKTIGRIGAVLIGDTDQTFAQRALWQGRVADRTTFVLEVEKKLALILNASEFRERGVIKRDNLSPDELDLLLERICKEIETENQSKSDAEKIIDPVPALIEHIKGAERAGLSTILMVCNTVHAWCIFDRLQKAFPRLVFINLIKVTEAFIKANFPGEKVAILCTDGTKAAGIYGDEMNGKPIVYPKKEFQKYNMFGIFGTKSNYIRDEDIAEPEKKAEYLRVLKTNKATRDYAASLSAPDLESAEEYLIKSIIHVVKEGARVVGLCCTELGVIAKEDEKKRIHFRKKLFERMKDAGIAEEVINKVVLVDSIIAASLASVVASHSPEFDAIVKEKQAQYPEPSITAGCVDFLYRTAEKVWELLSSPWESAQAETTDAPKEKSTEQQLKDFYQKALNLKNYKGNAAEYEALLKLCLPEVAERKSLKAAERTKQLQLQVELDLTLLSAGQTAATKLGSTYQQLAAVAEEYTQTVVTLPALRSSTQSAYSREEGLKHQEGCGAVTMAVLQERASTSALSLTA